MQAHRDLDPREIKGGEGEHEQGEHERDPPHSLDRGLRDWLRVEAFAFNREEQPPGQRAHQQGNCRRDERRDGERRHGFDADDVVDRRFRLRGRLHAFA